MKLPRSPELWQDLHVIPNARIHLEPSQHLETRHVLAGRYRGKDIGERALLTHTVVVDADERDVRVLCGFRIEGMADSYSATEEQRHGPPTCPRCLERWEKLQMVTVQKVMDVAASVDELSPYRYGDKVLLSRVASLLDTSVEQLKPSLLRWQREGLIELARVDMVAGMGVPGALRRSMIHAPGMPETSGWHAVVAAPMHTPNSPAVHYVWLLDYRGVPLDTEGPYGPMSLTRAEQFARIGAKEGEHDRVVSFGDKVMSDSFEVLCRYRRGTGERVR